MIRTRPFTSLGIIALGFAFGFGMIGLTGLSIAGFAVFAALCAFGALTGEAG